MGRAAAKPPASTPPGRIVVLNGAPRAGKSSIAAALQRGAAETWMNLGADLHIAATPPRLRPGVGLRPGGERPDVEAALPLLYAALYESVAAHSRLGLDVVVDVGHHEGHARPLGILTDCARRLAGLPALLVGVRCGLDVVMARRRISGSVYLSAAEGAPAPAPVLAWQEAVHAHGIYDLEVDTSATNAEDCAAAVERALRDGVPRPTAFERLAARGA